MSSVINFIVDVSDDKRELLVELLKREAKSIDVGIFFDVDYIPDYVESVATPQSINFELADNNKYCNCEHLLIPWWYVDCGAELFEKHMRIIERFALLCLRYASVVHLFIGYCGMQYADIPHISISPTVFLGDIKQRYEYDDLIGLPPPPEVHYIFQSFGKQLG